MRSSRRTQPRVGTDTGAKLKTDRIGWEVPVPEPRCEAKDGDEFESCRAHHPLPPNEPFSGKARDGLERDGVAALADLVGDLDLAEGGLLQGQRDDLHLDLGRRACGSSGSACGGSVPAQGELAAGLIKLLLLVGHGGVLSNAEAGRRCADRPLRAGPRLMPQPERTPSVRSSPNYFK